MLSFTSPSQLQKVVIQVKRMRTMLPWLSQYIKNYLLFHVASEVCLMELL